MRFFTRFLATATISLTFCGTFRNPVHELNECAHSLFVVGEKDTIPVMDKNDQRVLWDFNYGQDLNLHEIKSTKETGIHIYRGPPEKAPTGIPDGLEYYEWKSDWMKVPCMKLVAKLSGVVVEVLLSGGVPIRQVWPFGVCRSGPTSAPTSTVATAKLFEVIAADVASAKALTVALVDIAKNITGSERVCGKMWEGKENLKTVIELAFPSVPAGLIPRVVLVYGETDGGKSSSLKPANERKGALSSLKPEPPRSPETVASVPITTLDSGKWERISNILTNFKINLVNFDQLRLTDIEVKQGTRLRPFCHFCLRSHSH